MEESEYKSTYNEIARIRCEFEKALTNNKARCAYARHFWLADREGYACKARESSARCREFLEKLRENSRFALKLQQTGDRLPHNMEIRVQAGGLLGISSALGKGHEERINDIHDLLERANAEFGGLDRLPYDCIVQSISAYRARPRRNRN